MSGVLCNRRESVRLKRNVDKPVVRAALLYEEETRGRDGGRGDEDVEVGQDEEATPKGQLTLTVLATERPD